MSNKDINGVTIKLTDATSDDIFYFTERVNLPAYEEVVFKSVLMEGMNIDNLKLVFDFGGNPDGTEVEVSNIILQQHVGE
jgi:hypothetical protein